MILYESTPDNDGDALTVHTWEGYTRRDRPYLLNVATRNSDGDRSPALLDRADAEKLVEALADLLGWAVVDEDEEAAQAAQHAHDVALAKALVSGTLVRIAHTPMWNRQTTCADKGVGMGAEHGDRLGVVVHQVGDGTRIDYGVNAGRVVVSPDIDDWRGEGHVPGWDIHVSSLTPVTGEPSGFDRDADAVYTPRSDYRVGDTVLIADPAYVVTPRTAQGYVSPNFYGRVGVVTALRAYSYQGEAVTVRLASDGYTLLTQAIDVSSLQNISAEFRAADTAAGGTL